ncbi:MAG TPA: hypothetical protein VIP05_16460, partial [Burkholderiaceae bacterium]
LLTLASLAGSVKAVETAPPAPARRELLALAFPAWHPASPAEVEAGKPAIKRLRLPKVAWPFHAGIGHGTKQLRDIVEIAPLVVVRMDDMHAVLVTWALPSGDHRAAACDSYHCTYALGVYFFEWAGAGWHLHKRLDVAASLDGSDEPAARVEMWPGHGAVLGIRQSNYHGGDCVDDLHLIGLETSRIAFSFDMPAGIDENGNPGPDPCSDLLDPAYKPRRDEDYSLARCRRAQGDWRIDADAIRVDIEESSRQGREDAHGNPTLGKLKTRNLLVRLVPHGLTLKVVQGKVPDYML